MNASGGAIVIGVDPGRTKCGYAAEDDQGVRVALEVVPTEQLEGRIEQDARGRRIKAICVGHATTSDAVIRMCRRAFPNVPLEIVDETNTTLQARRLYYEDHPPHGILRWVPRGLLVPSADVDGYAALLILRRFKAQAAPKGPGQREGTGLFDSSDRGEERSKTAPK